MNFVVLQENRAILLDFKCKYLTHLKATYTVKPSLEKTKLISEVKIH